MVADCYGLATELASLLMPRGPSLRDRLDKATLEKLYNQAGLSTVQIATRYGSNSPAVLKLMDEYGIPRRSRGAGKT
jgi:hypothetical protein